MQKHYFVNLHLLYQFKKSKSSKREKNFYNNVG